VASLGDVGYVIYYGVVESGRGAFTYSKAPTNVVGTITDALPYAGGLQINPIQFFTQEGTFVQRSNVSDIGEASLYDVDDGVYYAQQIGTGNAWQLTVVGSTVTILRLSSFGSLVTIYAA